MFVPDSGFSYHRLFRIVQTVKVVCSAFPISFRLQVMAGTVKAALVVVTVVVKAATVWLYETIVLPNADLIPTGGQAGQGGGGYGGQY